MKRHLVPMLLCSTLTAQALWYSPVLANHPPARDTHAMATEPVSGKVVLFGGVVNNNNQYNDTWEWTGAAWSQVASTVRPSARESHAMAADGAGGVLLFGGESFFGGGGGNDTWRFAQGQWTRLFPTTVPPSRRYHAMVATSTGILMFGGFQGATEFSDTWEWIGNDWVARTPAHVPTARHQPGLAFDTARSRVVMYGGYGQGGGWTMLQDTWEWDGVDWQQRMPTHRPIGAPWLAYAPSIARVVSYGGWTLVNNVVTASGECWTWDGTDWTQVALTQPNPGPRNSPLVWSPLSNGLMTFAGHSPGMDDTWVSLPTTPAASYVRFGGGCQGVVGVPDLSPVGAELPQLGTTSRLRATNLSPAVHVVIVVIGLSTTQNSGPLGSYALPFDLAPFGMPGCQQLVSDNFTDFRLCLTGQIDWPLTVPLNPWLASTILHVQALSHEAPNLAAVTNGVTVTVGY